MESDGKDHPPMLAPCNYVQQKSRIKRYIDTKPNRELIHYCLEHEPYEYQFVANPDTPATPGIDNKKRLMMKSKLSQAAARNKGKEIANTLSPTYDSRPEAISDKEANPRDKEIEKRMALISMSFMKIYKPTNNNLRTSSNTRNKNVDNTSRFDRRIGYDRLGKLEAHYMYMEKIQFVIPDAADKSRPILDTQPLEKVHNNNDNYNVFANERHHPEQPESINDTYVMEKDDINITLNLSDMCNDEGAVDHYHAEEEKRALLTSLIANLKLEIDENK
ncbi:hypothetical protein Tco_0461942 [Tanacetum coccineum]